MKQYKIPTIAMNNNEMKMNDNVRFDSIESKEKSIFYKFSISNVSEVFIFEF